MNYGLPYKGSKSGICKWLMEYIPVCDVFVDVFSGGCAVTHAMMLENKAKRYVLNDLNVGVAELFIDALSGEIDNKYDINKFVSKDEFFEKKKENAFIRCAWSFGNDNDSYMYSKDSEIYRRSCHNVIIDDWSLFEKVCPEIYRDVFARMGGKVYDDRKDKRIELGKCIANSLKELIIKDIPLLNYAISKNPLYKQYIPYLKGNKIGMHISPTRHLESIERLEKIKNKDHFLFDISHCDYKELEIADGSCVYCDPPYKDSSENYGVDFNYEGFYDWCVYLKKDKNCSVFISEYGIDDSRFVCIAEKEKKVNACAIQTTVRTERLYCVR